MVVSIGTGVARGVGLNKGSPVAVGAIVVGTGIGVAVTTGEGEATGVAVGAVVIVGATDSAVDVTIVCVLVRGSAGRGTGVADITGAGVPTSWAGASSTSR
jgi:hypothetical protein